jgi:hypothetical protein
MVTWLTRSLLFIVVGAVMAFAVTIYNKTFDVQTAGVVLLLVGIFDLLLNFGVSMYMRQPPRSPDPYAATRERLATTARTGPTPYPDATNREANETRPIRRDSTNWH